MTIRKKLAILWFVALLGAVVFLFIVYYGSLVFLRFMVGAVILAAIMAVSVWAGLQLLGETTDWD